MRPHKEEPKETKKKETRKLKKIKLAQAEQELNEPCVVDEVLDGDENFDQFETRLCAPKGIDGVAFDADDTAMVATIEMATVREFEATNEAVRALMAEEHTVFSRLSSPIEGSWTQRFVLKRMKCKFVNLFFRRRVTLLEAITNDDELATNRLLTAYNGLSAYCAFHEGVLAQISQFAQMWLSFEQRMCEDVEPMLRRQTMFVRNDGALFLADKRRKLFLRAVTALCVKFDVEKDRAAFIDPIIALHGTVRRLSSDLYGELSELNTAIVAAQESVERQIAQMLAFFASSKNANPLIKDRIFNFISVLKLMNAQFKKLAAPKLYLNRMISARIDVFSETTTYVAHSLISFLTQWLESLMRVSVEQSMSADDWRDLQTHNDDELQQSSEDFLMLNFESKLAMLNGELTALNKLINDQIIDSAAVRIDGEGAEQSGKAILCETGEASCIYFYDPRSDEILYEIDLNNVQHIEFERAQPSTMTFALRKVVKPKSNKTKAMSMQFESAEQFEKWTRYLAPFTRRD